MEINKNLRLILKDIHVYDIEACHYTILNNLGFDLRDIDPNDKLGRNIKIGQMMRDNPRLTWLLRTTTESIINDYIVKNNIQENEIVIRQYDGIIVTRQLGCTNIGHIPLERRRTFNTFLSSIDRRKFIAKDNNLEYSIKGISHRYPKIDKIYKDLCNIATIEKGPMLTRLQKIRDLFFNSEDTELFGIPTKNDKFIIFLKGYGELEISKSTLRIMDTEDVDRERYFKFFIEPFSKSIVFENIRG